jgi:hypothetical protein
MLQGIFACFNVLSSSMSSSVAMEDFFIEAQRPIGSGLVRLEVTVKAMRLDPDFVLTKDEVLVWLGRAIDGFKCNTSRDEDEMLYHAVNVGLAAKLAETFALCEPSSLLLAELSITKALLIVEKTQDLSRIERLSNKAASSAIIKACVDRCEAKCPRMYDAKRANLVAACQSLQDFTYTKEEALESLARAIVWFGSSPSSKSGDLLFLAVKVSQAVALVNTFDLCDTASNMLSRFETKQALALVQQHKDDANFEKLVERAESEAKLKATADRLTAHKHSHTDLFVKKQPLAKEQVVSQESASKASKEEQVVSQESASKASKEDQVAKYPTRKYESKYEAKHLQDFTYTKDEALERLARAIVRFGTAWPISGDLDLLFLAVQVSQSVTLVNTFALCDTTSNMLSRSETKEALSVVQKHKDDANFAKLVERAESEAKLKATADRLSARKGDDRHFYTDHFVEKRHLSKEQPTSSKASGVVSFDDFVFSKAEALEWLARSIVKFGLSLGIPSKQPKLEWRAVSLVEASAAVRAFEPCEKTTKVLQHKHVKDAQLLVDQIQDAAKLDGLRNAVTLQEKCIVSAFRTTCQPTNYLRLLD